MARSVACLRKSKVTSDRHVSWEVQEQDVRKLAAQYGDDDLLILSDWSRSGREAKTRLRKDYLRLKEMATIMDDGSLVRTSYMRIAAHGHPEGIAWLGHSETVQDPWGREVELHRGSLYYETLGLELLSGDRSELPDLPAPRADDAD